MRLIHTSDWHLGRTLHGESLLEHQSVFLDWLLGQAVPATASTRWWWLGRRLRPGGAAATDAVALLDQTLVRVFPRLRSRWCSPAGTTIRRSALGFASGLSEAASIHLRTRVEDIARPVIIRDEHGEVGIYGIPYLLPDAVMAELARSARTLRYWPPPASGSAPMPRPAA